MLKNSLSAWEGKAFCGAIFPPANAELCGLVSAPAIAFQTPDTTVLLPSNFQPS